MMADKLLDAIDKKQNPCVVGLNPVIERLPKHLISGDSLKDVADAYRTFNFEIIDAVADLVPAVKPQVAFYEKYGFEGLKTFKDTVDYAKSKGLIVIEDGKRNDIGSTAQAYAEGHLGKVGKRYKKGIFLLVKTSNPSSGELQDRLIEINDSEKDELRQLGLDVKNNITEMYNLVALQINRYAQGLIGKRGYSSIGAVVGATYPVQAETLRKIMPNSIFLVPGYGTQGGNAKDLTNCFNDDGYGAIVNSSRGIIFAYEKSNNPTAFAEAARTAVKSMIEDICSALSKCNKLNYGRKNVLARE